MMDIVCTDQAGICEQGHVFMYCNCDHLWIFFWIFCALVGVLVLIYLNSRYRQQHIGREQQPEGGGRE